MAPLGPFARRSLWILRTCRSVCHGYVAFARRSLYYDKKRERRRRLLRARRERRLEVLEREQDAMARNDLRIQRMRRDREQMMRNDFDISPPIAHTPEMIQRLPNGLQDHVYDYLIE